MKKKITIIFALALITAVVFALTACVDTSACQHRDANDNLLCDKCGVSFEDGEDLPDDPTCEHRDADDNSLCDECGESFDDGEDLPDDPTCEHRDADDNSLCDKCGESFEDGEDLPDEPTCEHRDADDNSLCDKCGESFEDGEDLPDDPTCEHRDADDNSLCDKCGESFEDGEDLPDDPTCEHRDADDNSLCDECGESFEDGDETDPHTHEYTVQNTDSKYLSTAADCENAAAYYYSCSCGAKGTKTFSEGKANGHSYVDYVCTECGDTITMSEGLEFTLNSDGESYTVTGIGTCKDTDLVIPDTYNDKPVTAIGSSAFYDCDSLESIIIPNSVTNIGERAFYACNGITSVTIEVGITNIGSMAFDHCTSLTSITIPDSVTSIGDSAFNSCTSLTSITIPDSVTSIGDSAFNSCTSLTSVSVGNSVISIGNYAFASCAITSIIIPDSVTSIGDYAFSSCTITGIRIPDSITNIGKGAFSYCKSLESVTIPDSVTSIGNYLFNGCTSLTGVTIGNSVTSVGDYAFSGCTSLTSITIPDSVTSIGEKVFYDCTSLASVTIGNGVTSIDEGAFSGCTSLTSITIPDSVTSVAEGVFSGCSALNSITLPFVFRQFGHIFGTSSYTGGALVTQESYLGGFTTYDKYYLPTKLKTVEVTSGYIGYGAFSGCGGISNIILCDGITSIGSCAFKGCYSLSNVIIPNSVTEIGGSAFSGCFSLTSLTLPFVGVTSTSTSYPFGYIFGRSSYNQSVATTQDLSGTSQVYYLPTALKSVTITGGKITDSAFVNCNYIENIILDGVTSVGRSAFSGCSRLKNITILSGVANVEYNAFGSCTNLTNVYTSDLAYWCGITFDSDYSNPLCYASNFYVNGTLITGDVTLDGATSISNYAFQNYTSLTSLIIPNGLTSIGMGAFENCDSLESVVLGNSVTSIGSSAFENCDSLESVVLGNSVTSIGSSAFYNCTSLTSVTIPESVTTIGNYAFNNCTSLTSIVVDTNNTAYKSINRNLYTKDGKKLIQYAIGNTDTSFEVPESVTTIGISAFYNCTSLRSVTIGNSVTSIGSNAFYYCDKLIEVINKSTLNIVKGSNGNGYAGYYALEVHTGESKIVNKDGYLFYTYNGVNYLVAYLGTDTELILPESYNGEDYEIYNYAFYNCTDLTSVTIPDSVTSIGNYAFDNCTSLTSITIPDSVTSIGNYAFVGCTSLTSVSVGNSVISIGNYAFRNCTSLTSVSITDVATWCNISFGDSYANPLYYANNLYLNGELVTELVIPGSVASIDNYAFYNCTSLRSVTIGNSVTSIGSDAFCYCNNLVEVINKSTLNIVKGSNGNGYVGYYALEVHTGESKIANKDGYLFYTYNGVNYLVAYVGTDTELTLPTSYNGENYEIYKYAFSYCDSLTSVTIPDSVTSIGNSAFYNCTGLMSVTIGNSVTSIGSSAFSSCYKLVEVINHSALNIKAGSWNYGDVGYYAIEVHQGESKIVNKDGYLFYTYNGVNYLVAYVGTDTELVWPDNYNGENYVINKHAFIFGVSLTSVTIGNGVTSIDDYAFVGCTSLTSIKYRGTEDQWNNITKGSAWDYNTGSYEIEYEYDGE